MISITLPTDHALVRKVCQGDSSAFGRLLDRHGPRIFNLLRRLTGSSDAAEDLTQETFIAAYSALETWRGQSTFYAWLRGIAVRRVIADRRRFTQAPPINPFEETESEAFVSNDDPFAHCKRREAAAALSETIALLSESCRDVFILIRVEDMSYQAAADVLEIPLGTVQSRLNRATKFLYKRLAPLIYDADPITLPQKKTGAKHDVR